MHAFVQSVETLVFAMATAAYAHFGVILTHTPCSEAQPTVHRVSTASPAPTPIAFRTGPCPHSRDVRRA